LFAAAGIHACLTGRNEAALRQVAADIAARHGAAVKVVCVPGDVTSEEDVSRVVAACAAMGGGRFDILVNCAGVLQPGATGTLAASISNFEINMNTNARGAFSFISKAVPFLERPKGEPTSAIVNVSSVNGLHSFGGCVAYCASKAALDMITDCSAVDLAPKGIRVNSVNPGVTRTELQKRGGLNEEQYKAFLERSITVTHPLGRYAEPEEVAQGA
jgi:NAD(P)-dependent dehydrogenase (short-subunit alcohol dehydrogenase family)